MNNNNFYTVRGYQLLNEKDKLLTPSMEDYLEMIYRISLDEDYVRINELANKLNVRPSSATKIVQKLQKFGFINYQKYGVIKLTPEGTKIGVFLLKRHLILENFLGKIGVADTLKDTEMIEHYISLDALKNLYILSNFLNDNPEILKKFETFKKSANKKIKDFICT